jgi:ribosomal-protein-serine acetyltransferase
VHRGVGPGAVEIAYWVRSDRHNRGYATRAAEAITDAAFTYIADVDWVEIHMDCTNIASARVPRKLGYRLLRTEQREKLALAHTGEASVWQKSRDEWTPPRLEVPAAGTAAVDECIPISREGSSQ